MNTSLQSWCSSRMLVFKHQTWGGHMCHKMSALTSSALMPRNTMFKKAEGLQTVPSMQRCWACPFGFLLTRLFYSSVGREINLYNIDSKEKWFLFESNANDSCSLQHKWIMSSRDAFSFHLMEKIAPNNPQTLQIITL